MRASDFATASIVRMRINTIPANTKVNPASMIGSGQRIEPAIVDCVSPMLGPLVQRVPPYH